MKRSQGGLAAVTGASGYLGSRIASRLEQDGWEVRALVRSPGANASARKFDLHGVVDHEILSGVDVLVHAAYDFSVTTRGEIWRANVEGSRRLLEAAGSAGVSRLIVISTMSAYPGTSQLYGQAKLAIEAATEAAGGFVIRPGLVYGEGAAGMAGALRKMTRLPVVPLIGGRAHQYPVHIDDLLGTVSVLASAKELPTGPIGVASPIPVRFKDLMQAFAAHEGRHPRFIPVPWQLVYGLLRAGELARLSLPFRADSLLGLVKPAPSVPGAEALRSLGVTLRPFPSGLGEMAENGRSD